MPPVPMLVLAAGHIYKSKIGSAVRLRLEEVADVLSEIAWQQAQHHREVVQHKSAHKRLGDQIATEQLDAYRQDSA